MLVFLREDRLNPTVALTLMETGFNPVFDNLLFLDKYEVT